MKIEEIINEVTATHSGLKKKSNWGEIGLFYNPENLLPKGIYLLTFKTKDGNNDKASKLSQDNAYRLNFGISKTTFISMFGEIPKRPPAGCVVNMDYDFSARDQIIPHPVYGWMSWICVINPSKETFDKLKPLIAEGYELALKKYRKKLHYSDYA